MMSVLTGRYAMLKRTAGYSDLLFTFRGLPRRPVWVGWLTAAVFAQRFPEHYRLAAMMCYIQLSLMGIPAIVATGNSLTVAIKREMATPMFVLGHWHHRWQAERTRQAA